jgi:hypothetical protein
MNFINTTKIPFGIGSNHLNEDGNEGTADASKENGSSTFKWAGNLRR